MRRLMILVPLLITSLLCATPPKSHPGVDRRTVLSDACNAEERADASSGTVLQRIERVNVWLAQQRKDPAVAAILPGPEAQFGPKLRAAAAAEGITSCPLADFSDGLVAAARDDSHPARAWRVDGGWEVAQGDEAVGEKPIGLVLESSGGGQKLPPRRVCPSKKVTLSFAEPGDEKIICPEAEAIRSRLMACFPAGSKVQLTVHTAPPHPSFSISVSPYLPYDHPAFDCATPIGRDFDVTEVGPRSAILVNFEP